MFTQIQAKVIRDSLREIDFKTPAFSDTITQSYVNHYGLDFTTAKRVVKHCLGSYSSGPYKIACQYFALPVERHKATVVIVHGYYDHAGLYDHLIKHFLDKGYAVLIFDLPGHGLSSGTVASIDSFDSYSQALADCLELADRHDLERPWYIVGQSTGAAAIINALLNASKFKQFQFDKVILLAPLLRPEGWNRARIVHSLFRLFVKKVARDFADNTHDKKFSQFILEKDPLQSRFLAVDWVDSLKHYLSDFDAAANCELPIHIVQGTEDDTVDWEYNLSRLEQKFPNAKTYFINGARHHLVNESMDFRIKIFAAIDEILAQ